MSETRGYVLLVNARREKGFDLFVEAAVLCRDIPFLAIASQSDLDDARDHARAAGADNVTLVPRTDDMAAMYAGARVVAVPSYKFVETFSRVCIEAQRYGRPVIGSDVGNVPHLLERSGIVLPEDARAWAAEIKRLYQDEAYYEGRRQAARRNSDLYDYESQRNAILGVFGALDRPMLVGVGSGIGNMIHVSPMIRRLSEALGRKVDLVVAEDHAASLFLLHNDRYVNATYSLRQIVLARPYETVFLTHCFGAADVPFRGERVLSSRRWDRFEPDHALHEAQFNLEAARTLLGIDYAPEDVLRYYVGNIAYRWPGGDLVGFHGGSKDGYWVSKRWPFYTALAAELTRRGLRVASFGTPEEYVEGTLDFTGGSIKQMTQKMLECSYFVSNDSGVMNLANGLGIPLLAIFGPTEARTRGPLRPTSRTVRLDKPCAPCEWKAYDLFKSGACRCIGEIALPVVLDAFDAMLAAQSDRTTRVVD